MNRILTRLAAASVIAAGVLASSMAQAYERWINIHNDGSAPITGIYITHVGEEEWGYNLIDGIVQVGGGVTVEPYRHQGYCRFDIKIVYAGGADVEMWRVNLCEETDIVADEVQAYTV